MDEQADTDKDRTLRVQLELNLDRQPISGRLHTERGEDERFEGWLGFVEALERLHPNRKESQ
jgi:hypothetical protein